MAWDFSTDPEFQEQLDWAAEFVRTKVAPLDLLWPHDVYKPHTPEQRVVIDRAIAERLPSGATTESSIPGTSSRARRRA